MYWGLTKFLQVQGKPRVRWSVRGEPGGGKAEAGWLFSFLPHSSSSQQSPSQQFWINWCLSKHYYKETELANGVPEEDQHLLICQETKIPILTN